MHTFRVVTVVAAAVLSSAIIITAAPAGAADAPPMPRRAYPPPPPPPMLPPLPFYNWSGLYVGAHVGGGFADLGFGGNGSGFIGGGQIGYNWQIGQVVLGVEAEVSGSGVSNGLATFGPVATSVNWNSITTVSGRFGWAFNDWLVYGKAGGAWADVDVNETIGGTPVFALGGVTSGFLLGVGVEHVLWSPAWTAKLEYDHIGFGSDVGVFGFDSSVNFQEVKFGINYHFGPGMFGPPF